MSVPSLGAPAGALYVGDCSGAVFAVIAASNAAAVVAMLLLYRWLHGRLLRGSPSGGG